MENKYLDYEGLQTYHNKLVGELKDLKFNPQMMFESIVDLCDKTKWAKIDATYVYGLRKGLIVTVGKSIFQLSNPDKFRSIITTINGKTPAERAEGQTYESLGWMKIGGTDFEVDNENHILKLIK